VVGQREEDQSLEKHILECEIRKGKPDATIGMLASNSWTAVTAMPLRLALRMSNHVPEAWEPPMAKPENADPDSSGRVLLANSTGAFPTDGPGVGEKMANRYVMRREGELTRQASKVSSSESATAA